MAARWYVIHVYSGFEKKVAQTIKEQATVKGMASLIEDDGDFVEVASYCYSAYSSRCR